MSDPGITFYILSCVSINIFALWIDNVTPNFPMKTVKCIKPKTFPRATKLEHYLRWWLSTNYSTSVLSDPEALGS